MCRYSLTKGQLEARPTLVSIPVRRREPLWNDPSKQKDEILLVRYFCKHQYVYKTSDGRTVYKGLIQKRLRKGRTLKSVLARAEGRPLKMLSETGEASEAVEIRPAG